ncbi:MAG: polysaccharide deacetylase family protein [Candidatus Edwardsbacteria bacterium]|jgi:peptidoglycan/xylan/chitin deacetylase (PgdA/CDA1 family)|nr:polysaccharide deacetylase family protein [Candidatus Edwardsbacteria bacterium]
MKLPVILLYHSIAADADDRGEPTRISLDQFERQLDLLRRLGYRTIGLRQLRDRLAEGAGFGRRELLITFDDGYRDNHDIAWPTLREHGFSAVFFLATAWVGGVSDYNRHLSLPMISWDQAADMASQGAEFGSHGQRHVDLRALTPEQAALDLRNAKESLMSKLAPQVPSIAYPYGFSSPVVRQLVQQEGYQLGFGVSWTRNPDRYDLPRMTITRGEPLWRFRLRLLCRELRG